MQCWICGAEARTGEHLTKRSDLKALFGHVSQASPLYFNSDAQRNLPIKRMRSEILKSSALLCQQCNSTRTQPYDLAWAHLSESLRSRMPPIRAGNVIRPQSIFPGTVNRSMLHVHLFFVKLFGCMIQEHDLPLDIAPFRNALLREVDHPAVYIAFGPALPNVRKRIAGRSSLELVKTNGVCTYATWVYFLDKVAVSIIYAAPCERRKGLVHAWHPRRLSKRLRLVAH